MVNGRICCRYYHWPTQKIVSLFNQNSACDQIFTFRLVAAFLQGAGSQSQTQPKEENDDRHGNLDTFQNLV